MAGEFRITEHIADLTPPITQARLDQLPARVTSVVVFKRLKPAEVETLAEFLAEHPDFELQIVGYFGETPYKTLDVLKTLGHVSRLRIALIDLKNFDGLKYVSADLKELSLDQARSRSLSLSEVQRFTKLESLYLDGHQKNFEVVGTLKKLKSLGLRRLTLPDLSTLLPLTKSKKLSLLLGGTRDLSLLPRIGRIEDLRITMVNKLDDLTCLGEMPHLKTLWLQSLKHVTQLPSFAKLTKLKSVSIENLSGLTDLSPIAEAPALQKLAVWNMPQLDVDAFRCFVDHPKLKRVDLTLVTGPRQSPQEAQIKEFLPIARSLGEE